MESKAEKLIVKNIKSGNQSLNLNQSNMKRSNHLS